ncbi:MAG: YkoF family thiamine/hydroxymethylpyrimidine-binding protein [Anaerolineae bacterium]|nr:YkoF family thiamine/hydroxymethylpyrimidine-binding protein [Anaerolineae bacterium]
MSVTAQVSVYPLGQESFIPAIDAAIAALHESGLEVRVGPLSTLISGEEEAVFRALRQAFRVAAGHGATVMVATVTNACPAGAATAA